MTVIAIDARVKPTTDIFIMNSHYAPSALLENYESFVWTERYDEFGDLEIKYPRGAIDASSIAPGTLIGAGFSDRIMRVERIEDGLEDSGARMVTIKGVSIESSGRISWGSEKNRVGLFSISLQQDGLDGPHTELWGPKLRTNQTESLLVWPEETASSTLRTSLSQRTGST